MQLKSATSMPPFTRETPGGGVESYATTPPTCPAVGYWESRVRFEWGDGNVDDVVTRQPCSAS